MVVGRAGFLFALRTRDLRVSTSTTTDGSFGSTTKVAFFFLSNRSIYLSDFKVKK